MRSPLFVCLHPRKHKILYGAIEYTMPTFILSHYPIKIYLKIYPYPMIFNVTFLM